MRYLFNNEKIENYFMQIANLNNIYNGAEIVKEDFTKAFKECPDLDIKMIQAYNVVGYDFYYLFDYDIPIRIIPCEPKKMIELLRENIEIVEKVFYEEGDFSDILPMVEKRYYIHLFNSSYHLTESPTKRVAFREAYTMIEDCFSRIKPNIILDVFSDYTEEEKQELLNTLNKLNLEDTITIYRGANDDSTELEKALSWSLNVDTARFFATRFGATGTVYKATVKKDKIKWYFDDRNESEVIVFNQDLQDIIILEDKINLKNKGE